MERINKICKKLKGLDEILTKEHLKRIEEILAKYPDTNKKVVDKTSKKYRMALKFINKILRHIGMNEIDDLYGFRMVEREKILKFGQECKMIDDPKCKLYKYFSKHKMKFYIRKMIDHYIITLLKYMCKDLGLTFKPERKQIKKNKGFDYFTLYSII